MTTAEDARKLKGWFLENAGLEAQSLPMVVRTLWMMDSERWEAFQQEHTPNNLEEGVELVLSYLEATINGTAAQVAGPPAEGEYLLSPSPPAEGECLLVLPPQSKWEAQKDKEVKDREEECRLRARHPRRCNKPLPGCLLCDQDHLFAHCPFRSYGEEPERPQPKREEPERPQPKGEEPERPQPKGEEPERPTPEWEEPERPTPEWEEPEQKAIKRDYTIPKGYYETLQDVITSMNDVMLGKGLDQKGDKDPDEQYKNDLKLVYKPIERRIYIKSTTPYMIFAKEQLGQMLGFLETIKGDAIRLLGPIEAKLYSAHLRTLYPADIRAGFYTMYVYTDIIAHQAVGDSYVPLLRCVPIKGKNNDIITVTYDRPHYVPLSKTTFDTLTIQIKTDQNKLVPFRFGKVVVKLHFRPLKPLFYI
ncbi:UNVERIFIED_CONTAM: hypothetical protein FKN15_009463 [Acipenser sinensis]